MEECPITKKTCKKNKHFHVTELPKEGGFKCFDVCDECISKCCGKEVKAEIGGKPVLPPIPAEIDELIKELSVSIGQDPEKVKAKTEKIANAMLMHMANKVLPSLPAISDKSCPNCKMSLSEILKNSRIGCSQCYLHFKDELNPIISSVQNGSLKHTGKRPKNKHRVHNFDDCMNFLQARLASLVADENYEKAAVVRDKIKFLEQNKDYSKEELENLVKDCS